MSKTGKDLPQTSTSSPADLFLYFARAALLGGKSPDPESIRLVVDGALPRGGFPPDSERLLKLSVVGLAFIREVERIMVEDPDLDAKERAMVAATLEYLRRSRS